MLRLLIPVLIAALLPLGSRCLPAVEALPPQVSVPSTNEILKTLRPGHPRLLATADDFNKLKARVAAEPQLKEWYAELERDARDLLSASVSKYEIPDGLRLLATSRRVMNRIYTLAMMHHFEGDKAYAERAWKELAAAAAFPDWNPKFRCMEPGTEGRPEASHDPERARAGPCGLPARQELGSRAP
jgi:hypothetical protein